MIEANISAILLISGILILRKLFGTRLNRNCIYAVWLFVPLRLFLFPAFKIGNPLFRTGPLGSVVTGLSSAGGTVLSVQRRTLTVGYIADKLWLAGVLLLAMYYAVLAAVLLWRIKRDSVPAPVNGKGLRVRIVKNTDTAFLFGNTIYCSEKIYGNPEWMRYVTLHEEEHAKQADQLWGLLRIMLLCCFWYNPFIWAACYFSKQDCELACDERVAKKLSKEECRAYCKSLLEIATNRKFALCTPGLGQEISGGSLKMRILYLYSGKKKSRKAVPAAILAVAVLACITIGSGQITAAEVPAGGKYVHWLMSELDTGPEGSASVSGGDSVYVTPTPMLSAGE